MTSNYFQLLYNILILQKEFLEELFEWVLLFLSRFYLFYGLEILIPLRPVPLLWWVGGGGGGGAYFTKKIDLPLFITQFPSSFIC